MDKISKGKKHSIGKKTTLIDKRVPKQANRTGKVSEGNLGAKLPK